MTPASTNSAIKTFMPWGDVMLLLVAVVWGTSYGVAKEAVAIYPVLGFLAVRFCLTFLLLLPAWRNASAKEIKTTVKVGLPLGAILLAIFVSETYGLSLTLASNAAFLISMCVVFTPFVEWGVLRARPDASAFLAAFISLIGAFCLTSGASLSFNTGDWLMLVAALLRAFMVTFTKKLTANKDKEIQSLLLTAVQTGTVGFGCLILGAIVLPNGIPSLPSESAFWIATVYLVLFCTMFAFFAQNYAVRRTSPTRVSLLMGTEPVFGAMFAVYWLNESLSFLGWIGGILIVAASLWATIKHR